MSSQRHSAYRFASSSRAFLAAMVMLAIVITLVSAGCSRPVEEGKASAGLTRGGTLIGGVPRPASGLDPLATFSVAAMFASAPLFPPLIDLGSDGDLKKELVTGWASSNNARTWTFTLRQGQYLDGTPFTAKLVVDVLNKALGPAAPTTGANSLIGILSAGNSKALDDHTIEFTLDRPYGNFPHAFAALELTWLPEGAQRGDFAAGKLGGIGQFLLKSYSSDTGVVYVRNPAYWNADNILVDQLELKFYDDEQAIALALQSGEIDFAPLISSSHSVVLEAIPDIAVISSPSSTHQALRFRTDRAPFDDRRVRQAFALAIDRQAIIDILYRGVADIGNDHVFAPVFTESKAVVEALPQRTRDVAEAKRLLAQAGYAEGLRATVTAPNAGNVSQLAQLLQAQLKDAGIDLRIDLVSEGQYYGSFKELDAPWRSSDLGITWWGERPSADALLRSAYVSDAPFNESHYRSSALDALVKQYDAATDPALREQLALQIAQIQHEDVPAIIALFSSERRAYSRRIHGIASGPAGSSLDLTGVWIEQ